MNEINFILSPPTFSFKFTIILVFLKKKNNKTGLSLARRRLRLADKDLLASLPCFCRKQIIK